MITINNDSRSLILTAMAKYCKINIWKYLVVENVLAIKSNTD